MCTQKSKKLFFLWNEAECLRVYTCWLQGIDSHVGLITRRKIRDERGASSNAMANLYAYIRGNTVWKTTKIRRFAVRQTYRLSNSGPSLNPCSNGPSGFKGALNWDPMMPRDECLSDSCRPDRCCFSCLNGNDFLVAHTNLYQNRLARIRH